MATPIRNGMTDHSVKDGTGDPILGSEVDVNPNLLADILDGTQATDLGGAGTVDFLGLRVLDLDNAAGSVQTNLTLEWDPADGNNLTDNSSGVGIDFKMPDDADNQIVFGSLDVMCVNDANGSERGGFSFSAQSGGGSESEIMTLETGLTTTGTVMTLATAEPTVVDGDVLGRIDFQAPSEGSGTDAILVGASIYAEADDTFAADNNDTDLVFAVAESETAAERMRLSYDGSSVGLTFSGATTVTASGAVAIESSGGAISVGDDNVDQTVNLATKGTRTLNIGINDGTDVTTLAVKGNTTNTGTITVGVDDTGHDVKFFGASTGKYILWDEDEDTLQFTDNTNLTFGTGNDADIFYDGTDLNISPAVVGAGDIVVNGASMEFADSEGVTFGTGKDATIQYDGTNLVISPAAVGSGDVSISGGGIKLADSESLTLGTGSDATVTFDATNLVYNTAGYHSFTGGDVHVGNDQGVVIGHTAKETVSTGDGATDLMPQLQVLGQTVGDASMLLAAFSTTATTAGSPILAFAKGGNATIGSHTVVTDGEELGNIIAYGDDGTDLEAVAAQIQFEVDGTPGTGDMPGRIIFSTTADGAETATEHMKLASDGRLFLSKSAGGTNMIITNSASGGNTPYGIAVDFSAASPDNSSAYYLYFEDSTTARFRVNSDGDVLNHDGTYGTISDRRFKEQIVNARSYWDDFKRLSYKKFKHRTDVAAAGNNAPYRLGLIAQDVESVFPALVPTSPEEGTDDTYKWVKSSVVEGPIMAKVVQELQARVEALES